VNHVIDKQQPSRYTPPNRIRKKEQQMKEYKMRVIIDVEVEASSKRDLIKVLKTRAKNFDPTELSTGPWVKLLNKNIEVSEL